MTLRPVVRTLPLQEEGLRSPLAADHTDGPSVDELYFGIDASAGAVAQAASNHVTEMAQIAPVVATVSARADQL